MPHVDEGILHAYLDGALDALREAGALPQGTTRESIDAHLAGCADCRALLEAERTIRTRAGAVLDAAAPVVDVPPFSELVAASRARPRRRRAWPLAWAASVLLAVGAGYWGSTIFRSGAPELSGTAEADRAMFEASQRDGGAGAPQPVPAPSMPAEAERAAAAGTGLQDAATNARDAAGERREVAGAANEIGFAAGQRDEQAKAEREAMSTERLAATRRAARTDSFRAGDDVLGRPVESSAADTPAGALLAARAAAVSPTARGGDPSSRVVAVPPPAAAPPPPAVQQERPSGDVRANALREQNVDRDVEYFRRILADLDAGRVPLDAGEPPADLPLLQIDGGSAPTVQRGSVIGVALARITQRAPSGVAVELIVWKHAVLALEQLVVTDRAAPDTAAERARQRDEAARTQRGRAAEGQRAPVGPVGAAQVAKQRSAAPVAHTVVSSASLPDGRSELLLQPANSDVLVALRAQGSDAELRALAARLIELRRD